MPTISSTIRARRWYAEELRYKAKVSSLAVLNAFSTVPREDFVGRGPWRFLSPMNAAEYWTSDDADPHYVYHDVLIALDEERGINNGLPSLWAYLFDHVEIKTGDHVLHLGCGTGYYTAIATELTGTAGRVIAVEIDRMLANKARAALSGWHQVQVRNQDGAQTAFEPVDVIITSAGATHPLPSWLNALRPGGRLLFPMTTARRGPGAMLLVTRRLAEGFAARFLCRAEFIDFQGARDASIGDRLAAALIRDRGAPVKSLRQDVHIEDGTCWLHERDWCLSLLDPSNGAEA